MRGRRPACTGGSNPFLLPGPSSSTTIVRRTSLSEKESEYYEKVPEYEKVSDLSVSERGVVLFERE